MAGHVADMTVLELHLDHPLAEVDVRSWDQGTGIVDPEILANENPLVLQVESWDVGSYRVDHRDLETVDAVYLETEIAVRDLGNVVPVTVDAIPDDWKPRPVTGSDRSPVTSEVLGFLCPWDVTRDYLDPESSDIRRRIAPPARQVTEPLSRWSLRPCLAIRRLSTGDLIYARSSRGKVFPHHISNSLYQRLEIGGVLIFFALCLSFLSGFLQNPNRLFGPCGLCSISILVCFKNSSCKVAITSMQAKILGHLSVRQAILKSTFELRISLFFTASRPSLSIEQTKSLFKFLNRLVILLSSTVKTSHCIAGGISIPKRWPSGFQMSS